MLFLKLKKASGLSPKGHVEKGELPQQAALREAQEELGLEEAWVEAYLGSERYEFILEEGGPINKKKADYYLIRTHQKRVIPTPAEHIKARWFNLEEATQQVTFPGLKELFKAYQLYLKNRRQAS